MYSYLFVAPYDGAGGYGGLSNAVLIPNHPPVAELAADPVEGPPGLTVNFDAAGSYDIDGPIVKYEWDWEGDGTYDYEATGAATHHTYGVADYYFPRLRVHDAQGATDSAEVTIWVGRWHIYDPVTENIWHCTPNNICMRVVNGHPAISVWTGVGDGCGWGFAYVRAADALGESWGAPVIVDNEVDNISNLCGDNSLAVVDGHPALAYCNEHEEDYWYCRAEDPNGDAWGTTVRLGPGRVTEYDMLSLAVVNGHPAVRYFGGWFIRAQDPQGQSWGEPVRVPCGGMLLEVNGRPALLSAYSYVRANDPDGESWGEPVTLNPDPGYSSFIQASAAIVNGRPAVAYAWKPEGASEYEVRFVRALDVNGAAWGAPVMVAESGGQPSLAVVKGKPAVCYLHGYGLWYAGARDADGTRWKPPMLVEDDGAGNYDCLQEVNGCPAVSYFGETSHFLRYAIYY